MIKCAVCGESELESFDICDNCGWEQDDSQEREHDLKGHANKMSVNEAKKAWTEGKPIR